MMFGALPAAAAGIPQFPQQDQPQSQPPAPHPSFFGQGGVGRGIAGSIGDFLLQQAHAQPIFAPAMQDQRREQYEQQQLAAQKDAAWKQWVAQQQYKTDHPDAPTPTAMQNNYDWLKANHPELADQYLQAQTTAPPIVQHNADGTTTLYQAGMVPRSAPQSLGAALPPGWTVGGAPSQGGATFPLYPTHR